MNDKSPCVEVFFDGDCPLCKREIDMLRRWDRHQRIVFTDVAARGFNPAEFGKTFDDFMAHIQGRRLPSGEWIEGVEVFRQLYSAVGLGWLVAPSRLPIVKQVLDFGYRIFARNRLRLTGRCTSATCEVPAVRSKQQPVSDR